MGDKMHLPEFCCNAARHTLPFDTSLPWSESVAIFAGRLYPSGCTAALGVLGALPVMDRLWEGLNMFCAFLELMRLCEQERLLNSCLSINAVPICSYFDQSRCCLITVPSGDTLQGPNGHLH